MCTWMVGPMSVQRLSWDFLCAMLIFYDAVMLPLDAFLSTKSDTNRSVWYMSFEWCITIFWTLDIMMSLRTGVPVGSAIEFKPRTVAYHYFTSWFVLDIIIVGSEWAARMTQFVENLNTARFTRVFRFARFLRLIRLGKLRRTTRKMQSTIFSNWYLLIFTVCKRGIGLGILVHYAACAWYYIGQKDPRGWVFRNNLSGGVAGSGTAAYFTACTWTFAQINGRTDRSMDNTVFEKAFVCFCAMFTVMFMTWFISSLTAHIVALQRVLEEEQKGLRLFARYLDSHKTVSLQTAHFARYHIQTHMKVQTDVKDESEILGYLPRSMQITLLHEVRAPIYRGHDFFKDLNEDFVQVARSLCMDAFHLLPARTKEIIFEAKEPIKHMLFLEKGEYTYSNQSMAASPGIGRQAAGILDSTYNVETKVKTSSFLLGSLMKALHRSRTPDIGTCFDGIPLGFGSWICEPSLWVEWRTAGKLSSSTDGQYLALDAVLFAECLTSIPEAHYRAAVYAWYFVRKLQEYSRQERADDLFGQVAFRIYEENEVYPWSPDFVDLVENYLSEAISNSVLDSVSFSDSAGSLSDRLCSRDLLPSTSSPIQDNDEDNISFTNDEENDEDNRGEVLAESSEGFDKRQSSANPRSFMASI